MRGAGMLRVRTGIIFLLVLIIGHACGLPLQILPSIPGYIPVYIRNGDQPLIEINPALAEAFHETENYSKMVRNLDLDRIADQQNSGNNVEDSQNNDDINKIIDQAPDFVNVYNKNENIESNIMKINKVPKTEKEILSELTPEEVQFIKVAIVSDPLENVQGNLDKKL